MTNAIITARQLERAGACTDAVGWFREQFGERIYVTVERAQDVHDQFLWRWAAGELLSRTNTKKFIKRERVIINRYTTNRNYRTQIIASKARARAFAQLYIAQGGRLK